MRIMSLLILLLITPMLSGCAFYNAVVFSEDPYSYQLKGSKATIEVSHEDDSKICPSNKPEFIAAATVFAAFAQIAVNVASTEINSYLNKKQKEFTASYKGTVNLPALYTVKLERPNNTAPFVTKVITNNANCIVISRTYDEMSSDKPLSLTEVRRKRLAFKWAGQLVGDTSGSASKFHTDFVLLRRAAAKTDRNTRKVDVSVQLKLDVVTRNDKGEPIVTTAADKTLAFPALETPRADEDSKPITFSASSGQAAKDSSGESGWFAMAGMSQKDIEICLKAVPDTQNVTECHVTPATLSFLVTEIGSGSESFGELGKEIDDNKKTLGDAVNKALADGINKKAGSGK